MEFEPKGVDKSSASIISDLFRNYLFSSKKFIVVDRESMKEILTEQNLQQSLGCNSAECAVQLGKILGVNYSIIGSLGKLGNVYIVSAKMVNIENAQIEWTNSAKLTNFGQIDSVIEKMVNNLLKTIFKEEFKEKLPIKEIVPIEVPKTIEPQPEKKKEIKVIPARKKSKYPNVGIDLQFGFSPSFRFKETYYDNTSDITYWYSMKPGYFDFKFGLYWTFLYFGIHNRSFWFNEGDKMNYEDSTGASYTYSVYETDISFIDYIFSLRAQSKNRFDMIYFVWKEVNFTTYYESSESVTDYYGHGIGFSLRFGDIYKDKKSEFPVGFMYEFDINLAYMIYDEPDTYIGESPYGLSLCGNIGIGAVMKKYGPYLLLGYDFNLLYVNFYDYDTNFIDIFHGMTIRLGYNFDLRALLEK
jgi:TolB-like protein